MEPFFKTLIKKEIFINQHYSKMTIYLSSLDRQYTIFFNMKPYEDYENIQFIKNKWRLYEANNYLSYYQTDEINPYFKDLPPITSNWYKTNGEKILKNDRHWFHQDIITLYQSKIIYNLAPWTLQRNFLLGGKNKTFLEVFKKVSYKFSLPLEIYYHILTFLLNKDMLTK